MKPLLNWGSFFYFPSMTYPFKELQTERLILGAFEKVPAKTWLGIIRDKEVAQTTLSLPHPCTLKDAKLWRGQQIEAIKQGRVLRWSVIKKDGDDVIGGLKLSLNQRFNSAEIGYWVGKKYWGHGYASEAAPAVLNYGFSELKLNRIEAFSMVINKASSKILLNLGMRKEGLHRQLIRRWDNYIDVESFAILLSDWQDH